MPNHSNSSPLIFWNSCITNIEPSINTDTLVITHDNKKYKSSECIYVDGLYFHKTDKNIVQEYSTGKLDHIGKLKKIIINLLLKEGATKFECEYGYVYNNFYITCPILYSNKYKLEDRIVSIDNIKGWDFKESISEGILTDQDFKDLSINKVTKYDVFKNIFNREDNIKELTKLGCISPSYCITEGLLYSFGVEIECSRGFLPIWVAKHKKLNVMCVRDGSINNGEGHAEYVTGILKGDTGFKQLQNICLELSKRTLVNNTCGVHIHIGNINFSKQFLVNSYRLALILENEIFSTLPYSRRDNIYCKRLKKFKFKPAINSNLNYQIELEEDYNALFRYIAVEKAQNPNFMYNKSKQHPLGSKCGYNRDTPRYCWLNYVPAMFNTRENGSYSIEFRCMSGSTNFTKIKNWLLFTFAFVAFTEKYPEEIVEGLTIETIINKIFPKKSKSLNRYFTLRKELFSISDGEIDEYKLDNTINKSDKLSIKELINN